MVTLSYSERLLCRTTSHHFYSLTVACAMKIAASLLVVVLALCCAACSNDESRQANSTKLQQLFSSSLLYPSQFDAYIGNNAWALDEAFFQCLNDAFENIKARAVDYEEVCDQLPLDHRGKCKQENWDADTMMWLMSLAARLQNGVPWCQTTSGSAGCTGERLDPVLWRQASWLALQSFGPVYAMYLQCR